MTPRPQPSEGWQPIASAPRDGSFFLTCNANATDEYEVGCFNQQFWTKYVPIDGADNLFVQDKVLVSEFTHDNFHRATHWCAILPTPVAELDAERRA